MGDDGWVVVRPQFCYKRENGVSFTLFFIRRTRKHRGRHLRVRVVHVLATNGVHLLRQYVSRRSFRANRRHIRELHSGRVRRVMIDGALLNADKDYDERRIRTLAYRRELQYPGYSSILSHRTHRGKQ